MRLAVLSDVHGNLPALEAVLASLERDPVDGVIIAGDLVGGPQVDETVRLLRPLNPWAIRGNTDTGFLRHYHREVPEAEFTALQFGLVRWGCRNISTETLAWLEALPEQCTVALPGFDPIRVAHGSPRSPTESVFADCDPATLGALLGLVQAPVLVCGHTHIPFSARLGKRLLVNPGSVGAPLNGEVGAQYAVLAWQGGVGRKICAWCRTTSARCAAPSTRPDCSERAGRWRGRSYSRSRLGATWPRISSRTPARSQAR